MAGAIIVIAVCFAASNILSYRRGKTSGFTLGKRFILTVLKNLSPEAADAFEADVRREYHYEIFGELPERREE